MANNDLEAKIEAARAIVAAAFVEKQFAAALKGLQIQIELETLRGTQHRANADQSIRSQHLAEIDNAIDNARQRGSLTALSNLLRHRTSVLGLDKPERPKLTTAELDPPADPADHLAELVRAARRGRLTAEAQGSMVAAAHYLRQERELLRVGTSSDAQIARATDDDLLTIIKEAAANLPEEVRAELGDLATVNGGGVH